MRLRPSTDYDIHNSPTCRSIAPKSPDEPLVCACREWFTLLVALTVTNDILLVVDYLGT